MGIINTGSVDDIRSTLKVGKFTYAQLVKEISDEQKGQNRKTVLNMLFAQVKNFSKKTKSSK